MFLQASFLSCRVRSRGGGGRLERAYCGADRLVSWLLEEGLHPRRRQDALAGNVMPFVIFLFGFSVSLSVDAITKQIAFSSHFRMVCDLCLPWRRSPLDHTHHFNRFRRWF